MLQPVQHVYVSTDDFFTWAANNIRPSSHMHTVRWKHIDIGVCYIHLVWLLNTDHLVKLLNTDL